MNETGLADQSPRELNYTTYLKLEELLRLQAPMSCPEHPDELHFITTHQAIELWFQVMIRDIRRAREVVDKGRFSQACGIVRRITAMLEATTYQLRSLRHLQPAAFHAFRPFLGRASGLQSVQFRQLEVLLGLRDADYLASLAKLSGGELPVAVRDALREPSLADTVRAAGARFGVDNWSQWYAEADFDSPLYILCDALVDLDEAVFRWRCEHIILVEREIGALARGTAEKQFSYLESTLRIRFFPYLWEARSDLTARKAG